MSTLGNSMGMFQDNGISPGLSCLNQRRLLYSPKTEETGNLDSFLTDFHKENIGTSTKYANISLTVRLQIVVAKQNVRNRNFRKNQCRIQCRRNFLYFHQTSEILFNYCVQSISKEFDLTEEEGTQQNHSIENLHHK